MHDRVEKSTPIKGAFFLCVEEVFAIRKGIAGGTAHMAGIAPVLAITSGPAAFAITIIMTGIGTAWTVTSHRFFHVITGLFAIVMGFAKIFHMASICRVHEITPLGLVTKPSYVIPIQPALR